MGRIINNKSVAILQSNYIPWKGYFDIINSVDEFIIYDEMQYTRRDWRNRNLLKTKQGTKWLTIPVEVKGQYTHKINEIRIVDDKWPIKHWKTIQHNYNKALLFKESETIFEETYQKCKELNFLSEVNLLFINVINSFLGINTKITDCKNYLLEGEKSRRIISICKQAGANTYFTGPSAKTYLDEGLFKKEGILLLYAEYKDYPVYKQLFPPFKSEVSILDLIFNAGRDSVKYMKSFK